MSARSNANQQIKRIAKAVIAAFATSALTQDEINAQELTHTQLPWQCPPLVSEHKVGEAWLQDFLDDPIDLDPEKLYEFWATTLQTLYHNPVMLMQNGSYRGLRSVLAPPLRLGQHMLRFSVPAGFPRQMDEFTGAIFTLEAAHLASVSLPIRHIESDMNNFFVVMPGGQEMGIKNGKIIASSPWEADLSGTVQDLLEMPRGEVTTTCYYDHIARVRSLLHEHKSKFKDFYGLDYLLQALRKLSTTQHCQQLINFTQTAPMEMAVFHEKGRLVREAMETMEDNSISDKAKLNVLENLLVPAVMSMTGFRRQIFSNPNYPYAMAPEKIASIKDWLQYHYSTEIQPKLKRSA